MLMDEGNYFWWINNGDRCETYGPALKRNMKGKICVARFFCSGMGVKSIKIELSGKGCKRSTWIFFINGFGTASRMSEFSR